MDKINKLSNRTERLRQIKESKMLPYRPPKIYIGKNSNIHSTVVLGEPSYSMERDDTGAWVRGQELGDVIIGDDVEISPYVVVRRGMLPGQATIIGDGCKISAFVNMGHNSKTGKHVFIAPHVNLDGSVEIGDYCRIGPHVQVSHGVKVGMGAFLGQGSVVEKDVEPYAVVIGVPARSIEYKDSCVHPSFKHGEGFRLGKFCVIEEDVIVGDNVKLGHHVTLKSGTRFGNNIDFADYCKTTGICYVGNDVNIRTGSCISKSVIVEDKSFIGAGIMSSHTRDVYHHRPKVTKKQLITRIGYGAIIGSHVNLSAGIIIADNAIIGYGSVVTKSITESAIYVGNPTRKLGDLDPRYYIKKPEEYREHEFSMEMLKKYLPYCVDM